MDLAIRDLYHLDITAEGEDGQALLHGLLHKVHGFNSLRAANVLGVDFPAWSGNCAASIAARGTLRVLGRLAELTEFSSQPQISRLKSMGLRVTAPGPVRVEGKFCRVLRDVKTRQLSAAYRKRFAARNGRELPTAAIVKGHTIAVPMHSKSNQRTFSLFVRKQSEAPAEFVAFNSYGLTVTGAIPSFTA